MPLHSLPPLGVSHTGALGSQQNIRGGRPFIAQGATLLEHNAESAQSIGAQVLRIPSCLASLAKVFSHLARGAKRSVVFREEGNPIEGIDQFDRRHRCYPDYRPALLLGTSQVTVVYLIERAQSC